MNASTQRVLVVEDDPAIARVLELELGEAGYRVEVAPAGSDGLAAMERDRPDLVVLDVRLPDMDGLTVCRRARRSGHDMPILMLTALDRVGDRVVGLDAGADDYLAKPFALEELLARLRALLRRSLPSDPDDPDEKLAFADLSMDLATREVRRGARSIELTRTEFSLLELFLRRPRRVLDRSFILEEVWGFDFPTTANSLEVYVGYVRRKLEAEGEPRLLHTVRGVGYVLRDQPG